MGERRWGPSGITTLSLALLLSAGCSEFSCVDRGCPDRTEIYFAEPLQLEGVYVIEGTGTGGVPIDCAFTAVRSPAGGLLVDETVCAMNFLPIEGPDAGHRPQIDGIAIPARISSALLTVRHEGTTLYDGQATFEGMRAEPGVCNCERPVLRAQ